MAVRKKPSLPQKPLLIRHHPAFQHRHIFLLKGLHAMMLLLVQHIGPHGPRRTTEWPSAAYSEAADVICTSGRKICAVCFRPSQVR